MQDELRLYAITSLEAIQAMGGNRGKLGAQAAHACLHAWFDAYERFPKVAKAYAKSMAAVKIALVVPTNDELVDLARVFEGECGDVLVVPTTDDLRTMQPVFEGECGVTLVTDAGRTVLQPGTVTFLGVGPITKARFAELAPGLVPLC
ncbi:hypothetical protein CcrC1_gp385 [Caulobacter phage C1]|nr:hypothetical protein CcrC1_gp385 [Caulobacter phage C1]UTU08614.1 hypothetical protein CcrC2_gp386 [Caulobacter phage C2]UTU09129.1 hypothetical protein CcrJ4_gp380 [Caulobacter phage J4]UTU10247.1 hypothetical protein CcrRB23_gp385 [Caulobacter phage RB23]WGN97281.1 hypothetical protein [Bertelyvirus sp.]